MSLLPTIWCVGAARFVREIAPLLESSARVRWFADLAALDRNLKLSLDGQAIVIEQSGKETSTATQLLRHVQQASPKTQRVLVLDRCDLKLVRSFLETELAQQFVYRPLDSRSLKESCNIIAGPARAASHA